MKQRDKNNIEFHSHHIIILTLPLKHETGHQPIKRL